MNNILNNAMNIKASHRQLLGGGGIFLAMKWDKVRDKQLITNCRRTEYDA